MSPLGAALPQSSPSPEPSLRTGPHVSARAVLGAWRERFCLSPGFRIWKGRGDNEDVHVVAVTQWPAQGSTQFAPTSGSTGPG